MFPFVYEGQLFDECTDVDSEIDFVWCATEVYDDNTVIDGEWAYCQLGCPGTSEQQHVFEFPLSWSYKFSVSEKPCNHDSLGSKVGKCVNPLVPGSVPTWRNPSTFLLQNVSSNLAAAPRCGTKEKNRIQDYEFTCRCSNRTKVASNGQTQGNCIR